MELIKKIEKRIEFLEREHDRSVRLHKMYLDRSIMAEDSKLENWHYMKFTMVKGQIEEAERMLGWVKKTLEAL